jgi:hypothetical protein
MISEAKLHIQDGLDPNIFASNIIDDKITNLKMPINDIEKWLNSVKL